MVTLGEQAGQDLISAVARWALWSRPRHWIIATLTTMAGLVTWTVLSALSVPVTKAQLGTFALLTALAAFGRTYLSSGAGYIAAAAGWAWFFAICAMAAIPSFLLLAWLHRRGHFDVVGSSGVNGGRPGLPSRAASR